MTTEKFGAYETLGDWFEYLNDDCGYQEWGAYLLDTLSAFPLKEGIDIGCGNGYFTRLFEKAGYRMTGYDISLPMLNQAKIRSAKERLRSEYLLGDILALQVRSKVDFAIAINDCLNYIPPAKLRSAFKKVAAALKKGGVFLFDISSEYKLRNKVANTVSADDREEVTYLCFNTLYEDRVEMDVTLFIREADGRFVRKDEKQTQYIHSEESILSSLEEAGFSVLSATGHMGEEKTDSDRLAVLALRR